MISTASLGLAAYGVLALLCLLRLSFRNYLLGEYKL